MVQHKSTGKRNVSRASGIAVPLGALKTKECPAVGEYMALVPLARFCKKAGLSVIQLLPVNDTGTQSSPYSALSAFALHPVYLTISAIAGFKTLYDTDGSFRERYNNLQKQHIHDIRWNYPVICAEKDALLHSLYQRALSEAGGPDKLAAGQEFSAWMAENSWIPAYAVYKNLKHTYMQASWKFWPEHDRLVTRAEITERWDSPGNTPSLRENQLFYAWEQFTAYTQFIAAAQAVRAMGIILKGDIPILINEDSCDAWAEPALFNHDMRAGSPPDGDNPAGQNWGFPTYNWTEHEAHGFAWWKQRLTGAAQFYDAYRLDHILGFFRIWGIPEGEHTAILGHSIPYASLSRQTLEQAGFSKDRIHWLSEPHIPTAAVSVCTGSVEAAHTILSHVCDQIGTEELWNFKEHIKTESDIDDADTGTPEIRAVLASWWTNRTLIRQSDDTFIPAWRYTNAVSWQTVSEEEKKALTALFTEAAQKQELIWEQQARKILSAITGTTNMIPCGEDLGVHLACLPDVLADLGVLRLAVVRWMRNWGVPGQPFIPLTEYLPESVTTTSVHDSPTLRQWWNHEKEAVQAFETCFPPENEIPAAFSDAVATYVLTKGAETAGVWYINPLQDWLYLGPGYQYGNEEDERINIPGTVLPENWTYRIPVPLETITGDSALLDKIQKIAHKHDTAAQKGAAE
jgi:4-alpha-glucanotransferase